MAIGAVSANRQGKAEAPREGLGLIKGVQRAMTVIGPLACCRFCGHRDKVLKMEPEGCHAKKEVQPRVQA